MPQSTPQPAMLVSGDALRPLVRAIVEEVLAQLKVDGLGDGGRMAMGEAEAAAALGLNVWQLRDARLRGEIEHSKGPRGRILYRRADLDAYLNRGRGK